MGRSRFNLPGTLIVGALLCVVVAGLGSFLNSVHAAGSSVHEIRGTVHAVSPREAPPVIVVKSLRGSKEEITVGSIVKPGASVLRGRKKIGLDQIHRGDSVTLTYIKTREGLTVRSVLLH